MTDTIAPDSGSALHEPKKASLWHRLYHGETEFDFYRIKKWGFIISGVLLALSLVSLATRGLNLGLDFEGGVAWEVPAKNGMDADAARAVLEQNGINPSDAKIQTLSSPSGDRIRIQVGTQPADVTAKVRQDLATKSGVQLQEVSVNTVSPTWGKEITKKAVRALVIFLIAIAVYITFRFEWKMAIGAIVAVIHDVLISVGIYSIFGWEVTPATVIAFLTILGYSLYDTIVVFDKVHENTRRLGSGKYTYGDIVNLSMNQVLMRSLNTSLAALLPVLSLLIVGSGLMGAIALREFALALAVGLFVGAYSSIFIATPILAVLKEREPKYRQIRERLGRTTNAADVRAAAAITTKPGPTAVAKGAAPVEREAATVGATARPAGTGAGLGHPPRPRKKKRR